MPRGGKEPRGASTRRNVLRAVRRRAELIAELGGVCAEADAYCSGALREYREGVALNVLCAAHNGWDGLCKRERKRRAR